MSGRPWQEKRVEDTMMNGRALLETALRFCKEYTPFESISAPVMAAFTTQELLDTVAVIRRGTSKSFKISGIPFFWNTTEGMMSLMHHLDFHHGSGSFFGHRLNHHTRKAYAVSSVMEEASSSAALSGAMIRPANAKKMMRDGRPPKSNGEGHAQRAYEALVYARSMSGEEMSQNTLIAINDKAVGGEGGGLRTSGSAVRNRFSKDPLMKEVEPSQTSRAVADICTFVNNQEIHPLIRAFGSEYIILRLQPFTNANEVTARAVRSWCLARNGYDISSYLTISGIMKSRTSKYQKAFLTSFSEGDDMTYAISFCLESMSDAIRAFLDYVDRKTREQEYVLEGVSMNDLSARQRVILADLSKSPSGMTISEIASKHQVSYQTARSDLLLLAMRGLAGKGGRDGHKDTYVRTESKV